MFHLVEFSWSDILVFFMWSDCAYLRERLATNLILHLLNTWSIVKVVVSVWRAVTKNQNSAAGGIRSLDQNVPVSFHCNMCVFALAVNIRMAHWYYTYTNLFDFHHQQPLHLRLQIRVLFLTLAKTCSFAWIHVSFSFNMCVFLHELLTRYTNLTGSILCNCHKLLYRFDVLPLKTKIALPVGFEA